jgi:hypothetical protein
MKAAGFAGGFLFALAKRRFFPYIPSKYLRKNQDG